MTVAVALLSSLRTMRHAPASVVGARTGSLLSCGSECQGGKGFSDYFARTFCQCNDSRQGASCLGSPLWSTKVGKAADRATEERSFTPPPARHGRPVTLAPPPLIQLYIIAQSPSLAPPLYRLPLSRQQLRFHLLNSPPSPLDTSRHCH